MCITCSHFSNRFFHKMVFWIETRTHWIAYILNYLVLCSLGEIIELIRFTWCNTSQLRSYICTVGSGSVDYAISTLDSCHRIFDLGLIKDLFRLQCSKNNLGIVNVDSINLSWEIVTGNTCHVVPIFAVNFMGTQWLLYFLLIHYHNGLVLESQTE